MATNPPNLTRPDFDVGDVENAYFNGFSVNVGSGDVVIVLLRNGQPFLALQASYTVAKTLAQGLGTTISALEELTGNEIMTTHFIQEKLTKAQNDSTQ